MALLAEPSPKLTSRELLLTFAAFAVLTACGSTEPKVDSTPATITAASTDTIRAAAGSIVGTPLTVTVKNKSGEPIQGASVAFAVTSGGGSLSATSAQTNSTGQASTTWTLGATPGIQVVSATVTGLSAVPFVAIAGAGAPKNIVKTSTDPQSAVVGTNVSSNPSVRVTDQAGNPVSGVVVTFAVTQGNGILSGGTVNTDASGVATVGGWRLGQIVGANTVSASAAGLATSVTFTASGVAGPASVITLNPPSLGQLLIGQTVSLSAHASDAFGNALPQSAIVLSSSNPAVASVDSSGLVTALGAGSASINATAGTATAAAAIQVIGHPTGNAIAATLAEGTVLGDVAFTTNATLVSLAGTLQVQILDATATTVQGLLTTNQFGQFLVAPTQGTGPALQIAPGATSRVTFIDPASAAILDSLNIAEQVVQAAMTSDGAKALFLLSDGELSTVNVAARTQSRISLGGGTRVMKLDHGDSLLYVSTIVGVMFEVDVRSGTVKRQIILPISFTDFDISRDGRSLYLLDGPNSVVRVYDIASGSTLTSAGVEAGASSISVSPDGQQIWLTHGLLGTAAKISIYGRQPSGAFLSVADIPTVAFNPPLHVYFSPTGSFAAVTNLGGWVDIIR